MSATLSGHAVLDRDTPCLNCGYNLRTQPVTADCPECGMAVSISLRNDGLADAPPGYRRRLRHGAAWWLIGTLLTLPLLYVGVLVAAVGLWMLTAPQPGRAEPAADRALRRFGRLGFGLGALGFLTLCVGLGYTVVTGQARLFDARQSFDIAFILVHGAYTAGLIVTWRYLAGLAERVGDAAVAGRMDHLRRCWIGAVVGLFAIGLVSTAANWAYTRLSVYQPWVAPLLAALIAAMLVWLWIETWRAAWRLRGMLAAIG